MHIGFLLGSSDISGGTNVIFEHGSRLQEMGHRVSLITLVPVDKKQLFWHRAAARLEWLSIEEAKSLRFDVLLATWWQSVFLLEQLEATSYIYFVQSIESRFFPKQDETVLDNRDIDVLREWCESTYSFPLPVITEATWICDYLKDKYNRPATLVRNGIRKDIYTKEGNCVTPHEKGKLRVLVEGPLNVFFKNVEKTIELCLESEADEIWLLTSSDIKEYPGVNRCFSRVPIEKTAEIYRSCDVLVKLSYVEGMFGPPLEMFHCGGTVIVYDVTGHDEYIEHELNGLVVKRDDEQGVIGGINRLKNNHESLERLKKNATKTAEEWPDWQEQADLFAKVLGKIPLFFDKKPPFLTEYTSLSNSVRDNYFKAREYERMVARESSSGLEGKKYQNYIQVYYHQGEGFSNEAMLWDSYLDGDWCSCSVELPKSDNPIALRVDPSVRVGMVSIRSINISEATTGRILGEWNSKTGFGTLHIDGTCQCLEEKSLLQLFAYGEDPQLHIPGTYKGNKGHRLKLSVELRESGLSNAFRELHSNPFKKRIMKILDFIRP